jgi:hypothetical protein
MDDYCSSLTKGSPTAGVQGLVPVIVLIDTHIIHDIVHVVELPVEGQNDIHDDRMLLRTRYL